MAQKPAPKRNDPNELLPFQFQEFVQLFPDAALTKAKIKRSAFVAVGMMLSRHGDFKTGLRLRPGVGTLADEAGVSKPTVRKVLAYLQSLGAIVKTGEHRNSGGGSPVTEYRLYRSACVDEVLSRLRDRDYGSGKQETTDPSPVESRRPLSGKQESTEWKAGDHNRSNKERKENSLANAPSPAPVVAQPSARDGAADEFEEKLSAIGFNDDPYADILANL